MSFEYTWALASDLERPGSTAISFTEWAQPASTRVTRREWQHLLECWERLQPNADRFATVFFDTLFAWGPESRQLFGRASLEVQFLRFAYVLTGLVAAHDDPGELQRRIDAVARAFTLGTSPDAHDGAIRAAIAALLHEVSAARLTSEMRSSWRSAYVAVLTTLRSASYNASVATLMYMALRAELRLQRYHSSATQHSSEHVSSAAAA